MAYGREAVAGSGAYHANIQHHRNTCKEPGGKPMTNKERTTGETAARKVLALTNEKDSKIIVTYRFEG